MATWQTFTVSSHTAGLQNEEEEDIINRDWEPAVEKKKKLLVAQSGLGPAKVRARGTAENAQWGAGGVLCLPAQCDI